MSFLGVKVILFLVIPLIIKEKSNASALTPTVLHVHNGRYEHGHRPFSMLITVGVETTFCRLSPDFFFDITIIYQWFRYMTSIVCKGFHYHWHSKYK